MPFCGIDTSSHSALHNFNSKKNKRSKMIEAFLNQIDFNELATFAGSVVNVVLHGLIIAVIAAIPIIIPVLIMYAVEKTRGAR
jgi:hypothetical protein